MKPCPNSLANRESSTGVYQSPSMDHRFTDYLQTLGWAHDIRHQNLGKMLIEDRLG